MRSLESSLPPELFEKLEAHFQRTKDYFESLGSFAPEAVVLGGGYGRAEGGVYRTETGESALFNDLDYFIFTNRPEQAELLSAVHVWERDESKLLGIDVEGKCLPVSDVEAADRSMMFFDLVSGHLVVAGPEDYLTPYRKLANPETIDAVESTRLLWNRGSGLYFALCDLSARENLDLVHRNQSKVKLALGDAWLAIRGKYRALAEERHALLLTEEEVDPRIKELHATGYAFKKGPTPTPEFDELLETQAVLTELWMDCFLSVESIRLGQDFKQSGDYADYPGALYPDTSKGRNLLLAFRDRLKRGGMLRPLGDYPRGALQRALVILLSEAKQVKHAGDFLGVNGARPADFSMAYRRWWGFYS